jgi:hypothetical protein
MSKQPSYGYAPESEETFQRLLEGAAKLLFWAGLIASVVATAFLVFTFFTFSSGGSTPDAVQAQSNIAIFQKVLIAGLLGAAIGSTFLFWGEEVLCAIQLICATLLCFSPLLIKMATGKSGTNVGDVAEKSLATIQLGGYVFGLVAVCVLLSDIAMRIRVRALQGSRAELLKYGKGVKEERDIQNVFMGKCWQLPFCRKFVRERCPIYHSKRTCWRERVGCMCEEEVIAQAMQNRAIPRDVVAAAKFIPVNHRLTPEAKAQRCRQCVIYNEHQKHKYKLAVPIALGGYTLVVVAAFGPLMNLMNTLVQWVDSLLKTATYTTGAQADAPVYFRVVLLICCTVVCLTYTLRLIEYLIFKAKL